MARTLQTQMTDESYKQGNEPIFLVEIADESMYLATQTITTGGTDTREDGTSRGNSGFGATDYVDVLAENDFFGFINYSIERAGGWSEPNTCTVKIVNNERFSDKLGFSGATPYPHWENDAIKIFIIYDDHTDLVYGERQLLFSGVIKNIHIDNEYLTLGCIDDLGGKLRNTKIPQIIIEKETFNDAPKESLGKPIPIAYGDNILNIDEVKKGYIAGCFPSVCIDAVNQRFAWADHPSKNPSTNGLVLKGEGNVGYSYSCDPTDTNAEGELSALPASTITQDDTVSPANNYSTFTTKSGNAEFTFAFWKIPDKLDNDSETASSTPSDADNILDDNLTNVTQIVKPGTDYFRVVYYFDEIGNLGVLVHVAAFVHIITNPAVIGTFIYYMPDGENSWDTGHGWDIDKTSGIGSGYWFECGHLDVDRTYGSGLNQTPNGELGAWKGWDFGGMAFKITAGGAGSGQFTFDSLMLRVMYKGMTSREVRTGETRRLKVNEPMTFRNVMKNLFGLKRPKYRTFDAYETIYIPDPSSMYCAAYGRIGGGWINGRNSLSTGDLIETPEYIIESILRDEMSYVDANIDGASFDSAYSATYKMAFSINSRISVSDIIDQISLQGKLRIYFEPDTTTNQIKVSRYIQTANFTTSTASVPDLEDIFEETPETMDYTKADSTSLINDGNGITSSNTSITVDDNTDFTVNKHILIDREIMYVTDVSGNPITVTRGMEGTTAVRHEDNTKIYDLTDSYLYTDANNWHPRTKSFMTNPIAANSLSITMTSLDDIANQVYINYKENINTGELEAQSFIKESDSSGNDLQREKLATHSQSSDAYNMIVTKEIDANLIRDATTAESLRDHIFDVFSERKKIVTFKTFFNALDKELGNIINIRHRLLEGMFKVRSKSLINDGNFNATEVTFTVDDGDDFELFKFIVIDDEIMKVTAISTNLLTVDRACLGTDAAAHNDNSIIYHLETFKVKAVCDGATGDTATDTPINVTASMGTTDFTVFTYVKIESEIMFVTATAANNITVVRGVKGTTIAQHSTGTAIYQYVDYLDKKWETLGIKYLPDCTIEITAMEL